MLSAMGVEQGVALYEWLWFMSVDMEERQDSIGRKFGLWWSFAKFSSWYWTGHATDLVWVIKEGIFYPPYSIGMQCWKGGNGW